MERNSAIVTSVVLSLSISCMAYAALALTMFVGLDAQVNRHLRLFLTFFMPGFAMVLYGIIFYRRLMDEWEIGQKEVRKKT